MTNTAYLAFDPPVQLPHILTVTVPLSSLSETSDVELCKVPDGTKFLDIKIKDGNAIFRFELPKEKP